MNSKTQSTLCESVVFTKTFANRNTKYWDVEGINLGVIKTFFMLNSTEYSIYSAHNC